MLDHPDLLWLGYWLISLAVMILLYWWNKNDLTVGDLIIFTIGTAIFGLFFVAFYLYTVWDGGRSARQPKILIRGRGK